MIMRHRRTRPTRLARPSRARSSAIALLGLLTLLFGVGCVGIGGASGDPERPTRLPRGINDSFLAADLDVAEYIERFEGESRDVFAQRQPIVDALSLAPGDAIADIGAGTGFFSFLFAEAVGDTGRVYAVEISPRFLDHLRTRRRDERVDHVEVVEATERSVSLPEASVDVAFVCDVYHHFEYPQASLASLHRAVRPGGSLVLIDFERIPGVSPQWLLDHVRAGREVFSAEIEAAGFRLREEIELDGLDDNYVLRFERVD